MKTDPVIELIIKILLCMSFLSVWGLQAVSVNTTVNVKKHYLQKQKPDYYAITPQLCCSLILTLAAVFCFLFVFWIVHLPSAVKATLSERYKHLRSSQSTVIVGRRMEGGEEKWRRGEKYEL